MRKILTFILILCTVALFAEMRGGAQYDPGAARSNLTNITSGSALGVANGGTGKTTAAEALAALGGASLNGSSTVAFNASTINGVVPLTLVEKGYLVATGTILGAPTNSVTVNIASLTGNITGVYRVIAHSTTAENFGDDFAEILAVRKNHVGTSYTTRSSIVAQYESSVDNSQIVVATATSQITFNVSNTSNLHYRIQLQKVGEAYKNGTNPE